MAFNPHYYGKVELYCVGNEIICPTCLKPLTPKINAERREVSLSSCCRTWPLIPLTAFARELHIIKHPEPVGVKEANPQQITATKKVR